jgi:hypothetical protein
MTATKVGNCNEAAMKTGIVDRYVIGRDRNVIRVDFQTKPEPPAPKFPGASALRNDGQDLELSLPTHPQLRGGTMIKGLFALLMAGSLLIPHITPASGNESVVRVGSSKQADSRTVDWLTLLSTQKFERVPWIKFGSKPAGPRNDLPVGTKLDTLEPFLLPPSNPDNPFPSTWKFEPQGTKE